MDSTKESEMFNQSEAFNQMADYYDTYRPGYPIKIIQTIVQKTNLTAGSKLLEIGAGSGKATAQFADYGFEMRCIDPGADLVQKGNRRFKGKNIEFIASRFEAYDAPPQYFDAVFSAQAFHWVPQPVGYQKCAATLRKGGHLALFWNIDISRDTDADKDLLRVLNRYDGFTSCMSQADYRKRPASIASGIVQSGLFTEPEITHARWKMKYTADAYFGYMLTGNVFVQKPDAEKQACYQEIKQLATKHNGIERHYVCELYVSQKAAL